MAYYTKFPVLDIREPEPDFRIKTQFSDLTASSITKEGQPNLSLMVAEVSRWSGVMLDKWQVALLHQYLGKFLSERGGE